MRGVSLPRVFSFFKYNARAHQAHNRYNVMFTCFVGVILFPLIEPLAGKFSDITFQALFTVLIFSGLYVVTFTKRDLYLGLVLAMVAVVPLWEKIVFGQDRWPYFFELFFSLLFFAFIGYHLMRHVFRSRSIDMNLILGALVGYLLVGLMGGILAAMIDSVSQEAYPDLQDETTFYPYLYYSFVTLTTVGYGDVTPNTDVARALSLGIGLSGQIYLTVILAILIAKYMGKKWDDS